MERVSNHLMGLCGEAFLAYAAVSLLWAQGDRVYALSYLLSFVVMFSLGWLARDLRLVWATFLAFLTVNVAVVLATQGAVPFGIFGNQNYFGCALAFGLAVAISQRQWWFVLVAVLGLWLSPSRGAMMGAAVISAIALWPYHKIWLGPVILAGIAAWLRDSDPHPWMARLGIWQDTLNHMTLLGSGWGSFYEAFGQFPLHHNTNVVEARASHAYNDFLELTFELGLGSIFLWFFLTLALEGKRDRLICLGFLALTPTFFPLWVPPLGHLFALALGHTARSCNASLPRDTNRDCVPRSEYGFPLVALLLGPRNRNGV